MFTLTKDNVVKHTESTVKRDKLLGIGYMLLNDHTAEPDNVQALSSVASHEKTIGEMTRTEFIDLLDDYFSSAEFTVCDDEEIEDTEESASVETPEAAAPTDAPADYDSMTKAQLLEVCEQRNIEAAKSATKSELLEAVRASFDADSTENVSNL